jgi:hypothetical protein
MVKLIASMEWGASTKTGEAKSVSWQTIDLQG